MASGWIGNVHLYAPDPVNEECALLPCPTCERARRMHVVHYEWHGALVTCCGCGERWSDGEMIERPFARGWRDYNRTKAIRAVRAIGGLA